MNIIDDWDNEITEVTQSRHWMNDMMNEWMNGSNGEIEMNQWMQCMHE